jgi:hypothetical protein
MDEELKRLLFMEYGNVWSVLLEACEDPILAAEATEIHFERRLAWLHQVARDFASAEEVINHV